MYDWSRKSSLHLVLPYLTNRGETAVEQNGVQGNQGEFLVCDKEATPTRPLHPTGTRFFPRPASAGTGHRFSGLRRQAPGATKRIQPSKRPETGFLETADQHCKTTCLGGTAFWRNPSFGNT